MFDIPGTKLEGMISIYLAGDANILVSSHRRVPPFLSSWILSLLLFRKLVESKRCSRQKTKHNAKAKTTKSLNQYGNPSARNERASRSYGNMEYDFPTSISFNGLWCSIEQSPRRLKAPLGLSEI